ncbi:VHS domain-containing protein At3g16270 isoform X3 [Vigna radiata var. radiata]|uniref:VHS domain-containing protein At3g16270 isoform X3 n=1 Tax=Vigna radiata var. radiata TaxID=3916 RepID=A0A3Q0F109_VIGRR|nr:VHS domain-containing protein At3g16270 isoform X3 [Vigna radiata var. radiata]
MESSRRAVESYWRWRLIDSATSDEEKVTPVYKLDEICELLRSSHPGIVKELSEFILKRLDNKSPVVKHKTLRLIKYAIGKCGVEFRREMQRHSVVIRQLLQYKGQLDPLKGDALNKAVRDTAQEAISAIFSADDNISKPPSSASASADLNRRIEGFGNTNYQAPSQDKKSFLSEVVDIGSATIKQGLSAFTQGHSSLIKNEAASGTYKDRYEPTAYGSGITSALSKNQTGGPWNQDAGVTRMEMSNGKTSAGYAESKTQEERLLETVASSGGVRLQPSRDAIQVFLREASKLDAMALCHALEQKLQSPMWQVRVKAVCVLESILRNKDDDNFLRMATYFAENKDLVLRCSDSPQASLREKANKVLGLLGGGQPNSSINSEKAMKMDSAAVAEFPDLLDTGDFNDYHGTGDATKRTNDKNIANLTPSIPPALADDLFGNFSNSGVASNERKNNSDDDDPFADVSFHSDENKEHSDIFSRMTVGNDKLGHHASHLRPDNGFGGMLGSQAVGFNVNSVFPSGHPSYTAQPGIILNQPYSSQPLNYGAMGNLLAQQQFLATVTNFQHLNNVNRHDASSAKNAGSNERTPLPDIFQSKFSTQTPSSMISSSKKEETKAFDFISLCRIPTCSVKFNCMRGIQSFECDLSTILLQQMIQGE